MPIAKLSIDLEARLTKLESDLKQATSLAEKSASNIKTAFSGVALVFTGLAGALSVGALKGAFDKYVEGAANLDRLARVAGTTTENMSALSAVAKVSGTDVDQVAQMMVRLAIAISKGDDESKNAGKAFAALGISVESLRKLDPSDQLKTVADALSTVEKGSEKTALQVGILGKAGAQATPYLQALAETGALVAKVSTEQGNAAKEYEQNLRKLEAAQGAVAKIIAAELVPAASLFVRELVNVIQKSDGVRAAVGDLARDGSIRSWAENAAVGAAKVIDVFAVLKLAIEDISIGLTLVGKTVQGIGTVGSIALGPGSFADKRTAYNDYAAGAQKDLDDLVKRNEANRKAGQTHFGAFSERVKSAIAGQPTDRFLAARSAINAIDNPSKRKVIFPTSDAASAGGGRSKAAKALDDGQRLIEQLRDRIRSTQDLSEVEKLEAEIADGKYKTASAANLEIARGYAQTLDAIKASKVAADEESRVLEKRASDYQRIFDATRTPVEALNIEIERLVELLNNGTLGEGAAAMELFGRAAAKAGEEFQAIKKPLSEMDQFAVEAARNIQDAFAEFLFDPFKNGTEGMLKGFGDAIRKMIANAIAADLAKRLFGDIGAGNGVGGLAGDALKWIAGALPSFAVGTDYVPRDMVAQIHQGEAIVPAAQNRGSGGHTFVVNQYLSGSAGALDVRRAGGDAARSLIGAVGAAMRFR